MLTKLAKLEKTIGKTLQGFQKTITVLESTTAEYEGLKVEIQERQCEFDRQIVQQQESINATHEHIDAKLTETNNLLKNFKGLLGI